MVRVGYCDIALVRYCDETTFLPNFFVLRTLHGGADPLETKEKKLSLLAYTMLNSMGIS